MKAVQTFGVKITEDKLVQQLACGQKKSVPQKLANFDR